MPKLKTHKATKKRISARKTGKLQYKKAFGNHFLEKKSGNRKRRISTMQSITGQHAKNVRKRLGI